MSVPTAWSKGFGANIDARAHEKGPELAAMLAKVTQALRIRIEDTNEDALQDDLDDNHVTAAERLLIEIGWKK